MAIYISKCIYPPAPACQGPPGCEAFLPMTVPKSFQSFKSQVDSPKSFQSFKSQVDSQVFHFQSAISSLPVWCQLLAVCRSAIWCLVVFFEVVTGAREWGVTLTWVCTLNLGPPRVSLKNHRISSLSPGPSQIRKSAPKGTKSEQKGT